MPLAENCPNALSRAILAAKLLQNFVRLFFTGILFEKKKNHCFD